MVERFEFRMAHPLILAMMAALVLASCGRRGDLEPAPDPSAVGAPVKPDDDAGASLGRKKVAPIVPPKQDFILDPLL